MSVRRYHSLGLAAISSALALFSRSVTAITTIGSDSSSSFTGCERDYIADGECDGINNKAFCEYDGGDCCPCTCVSTEDYICGESLYYCIDPSAPCVDDDETTTDNPTSEYDTTSSSTITSLGCVLGWFSNGFCNTVNNNEICDFDGGDCCECTCIETKDYDCGDGFACLDPAAPCFDDDDFLPEDDDDETTTDYPTSEYDPSSSATTTSLGCIPGWFSDGFCDETNNNERCDFDGGDCCECTCVSTDDYDCGQDSWYARGFACLDPAAPCADDDFDPEEYEDFPEDDDLSDTSSSSYSMCNDEYRGDGSCDADNNMDGCGYDGGDCCECDCVSTDDSTCGDKDYDCIDPSSSCINGYVLASTMTTIGVTANAYDTRPGEASGDVGCGEDGCAASLSLDGISDDNESRWSCAQNIVADGGLCEIEFAFEDSQDIMDVQVAFWNGEHRFRTLEAKINGEVVGEFNSYTGSTFNALGIVGVGVQTVTLTTSGLDEDDWISLLEVRFLVEP